MPSVLENIKGWAHEVFLVDSYSSDDTVNIALSYGVRVYQRSFRGFGDQWNFAVHELPLEAPWCMKIDPDERLTNKLKNSIENAIADGEYDAFELRRRLWFMGKPLPIKQTVLRLWRTGLCKFSDVSVNEYPIVEGRKLLLTGELEHYDSPDLGHWFEKQNEYTTALAISAYNNENLSFRPTVLGSSLQRRMWLKKNFRKIPLRYVLSYIHNLIILGAWRAGSVGFAWARMRVVARRMIEDKILEIQITGRLPPKRKRPLGSPNPDATQAD